jgi:hypothetical protein
VAGERSEIDGILQLAQLVVSSISRVQHACFVAVLFAAVTLIAVQTFLEVENSTRTQIEVEFKKRKSFNLPCSALDVILKAANPFRYCKVNPKARETRKEDNLAEMVFFGLRNMR